MKKIMFVCHGNICRSPMAEFITKKLISERGLEGKYLISSSATSTEELGNPIYPPARRELIKHGITDIDAKFAVQLSRADLDKYDVFVAMDNANVRNIYRMLGDGVSGRVYKMMSFVGSDADVADPWYCGGFDVTYSDIFRAANAMLDALEDGEI